jgi:Flp pilus assembly protein TadG
VSASTAQRRQWIADQRGVASIEFAIVGPAFIVMLVAIVVFGWSMHSISSLRLAVESAARALEINQTLTQSQLTSIVQTKLTGIGDTHVTVALADDTSIAGVKMKKITGTYVFDVKVPLLDTQHVTFTTSVSVPLLQT